MTVVEHLDELRTRLLISLGAVLVASIVGLIFYRPILRFLSDPYCEALRALPERIRPEQARGCSLIYTNPTEPFLTFLKVGLFSGFLLALPVVLWELWRFITPGLTRRERRLAVPFVLASVALFAGGTVFALSIAPRGLRFLFSFGGESLVPLLTIDRYLGFLMFLILAFGISFELPLVLVFLAGAGVVSSAQMRRWRRWALLGTAVVGAVATPTQDPYTMLLMWIPLYLLYEGAILIARLLKR
jgi:sec-independent protein translocase protein TatC